MNEEILIALGDLTNGALNYYQTPRVVMAKRDIIETYINNLKEIEKEHQKINGELREEIKGIREERDYLFNKLSIENKYLSQENQQLKDIRETAINYIDQVIMYKPCAREIDKELDILIGILRGGNDEQ